MGEEMSDILVVGSLAYDTITTPSGKADRILGGSANYFSVAASQFAKVRVIGVVGQDYDEQDVKLLEDKGVDVSGMQRVLGGKTFHWEGQYKDDLNEAITIETALNVFSSFNPTLSENHKNCEYLFLANIDPDLQLSVLDQVKSPKLVASDTMNLWIDIKKNSLLKVIERIDLLTINETESKLLTHTKNAISAAREILKMGPKAVVIKRGEYGFVLATNEGFFILPAFPVGDVVDPTGAGDTFAGGLMGYLAATKTVPDVKTLKQGCVLGTILASFTIQDFGLNRLKSLSKKEIDSRRDEFVKVVAH